MTKPTYEEMEKQYELIAELAKVVSLQVWGEMDELRAMAYWQTRLPTLLQQSPEFAAALTYALHRAALNGPPFGQGKSA